MLTEGRGRYKASSALPELQLALQDVLDQFPFQGMSIQSERINPPRTGATGKSGLLYTPSRPDPGMVRIELKKDLPMLASSWDFKVIDEPFTTNILKAQIDASLQNTKYGIVAPEWKSAARRLKPLLDAGKIQWVMNLGLASRPGLHPTNWRDALIGALWMESLLISPESADWSGQRRGWVRASTAGKMAVAGRKAWSTDRPFGVSSRELGSGLGWLESILAPSVGLRGNAEYPLQPRLLSTTGQFEPIARALSKSIGAAGLAGERGSPGINLKALQQLSSGKYSGLQKDVFESVYGTLQRGMGQPAFDRLLELIPDSHWAYWEKEPLKFAGSLIRAARNREEFGEAYFSLADEAEKALRPLRKSGASMTTLHKAASQNEASRFIEEALKKAKKPPLPPGRMGAVLLMAGILSSGLIAAGAMNGEETA